MTQEQHKALSGAVELLDKAHDYERKAWRGYGESVFSKFDHLKLAAQCRAKSRELFELAHGRGWRD